MSRALVSRYHPTLVALHWLLALMIIGLLCFGFFVLAHMPNDDPKKIHLLVLHMTGGMFVLVLMILRVIIRMCRDSPAAAPPGSSVLDRLATVAHYSLYAIVFLMIVSGWSTGFFIRGAFQPDGGHLPESFAVFPTFRAHALLAALLAILLLVHIAASFYHHLVLKDGLFRRVWFGRRTIAPSKE